MITSTKLVIGCFSGSKSHDTSLNRSVEMSEIDARLNALQQYMKENME